MLVYRGWRKKRRQKEEATGCGSGENEQDSPHEQNIQAQLLHNPDPIFSTLICPRPQQAALRAEPCRITLTGCARFNTSKCTCTVVCARCMPWCQNPHSISKLRILVYSDRVLMFTDLIPLSIVTRQVANYTRAVCSNRGLKAIVTTSCNCNIKSSQIGKTPSSTLRV